jgi:hypothetical protein
MSTCVQITFKIMACFTKLEQKRRKLSDYEQFESFPNELLIKIFDYVSLDDLYQSFKGLNQRIDNILQSLNNRFLRLWSNNDKMQMIISR